MRFSRVLALSLATVLAAGSLGADAAEKLKNLKDGLLVQLRDPLANEQVEKGDVFNAILTQDYTWEDMTLPAGTEFRGQIIKEKESRHLLRPGYLVLRVDHATMPDGTQVNLEEYPYRQRVLHSPEGNNPRRSAKVASPFVLVNSAVQLPLKYAADWPSQATIPIAVGAKMLVGVTREFLRDDKPKDRPIGHKVGYGMLVGTGIPGFLTTVSKKPEPDFEPGDNVNLYLDPEGMRALFEATRKLRASI